MIYLFIALLNSISALSSAPESFHWCVATSAHQTEGSNTSSDWWAWEQVPGHIHNSEKSGDASDHWRHFAGDILLMKSLGVTDYRMSIEWAKIEPEEGKFNQEAIQHYQKELALLRAQGIRPIITLHHFSFPLWLAKKGGWEWSGSSAAFANFTKVVYGFAGGDTRDWITINEPMIYLFTGYLAGIFPPGEKRSIWGLIPPLLGLLRAHAAAYKELHSLAAKAGREVRVGIAHSVRAFEPANNRNGIDSWLANKADEGWNWLIPSALETGELHYSILGIFRLNELIPGLAHTQDYLGFNYYTGDLLHFSFRHGLMLKNRQGVEKNDLGWDIYPEGMRDLLAEMHKRFPKQNILITENGIADASDAKRPKFLIDHLQVVSDARRNGIPVEGFCYWSLLDNFEWAEGFAPRFGLYRLDYKTQLRTRTHSADVFSEFVKRGNP